jgi:hypothetical protein
VLGWVPVYLHGTVRVMPTEGKNSLQPMFVAVSTGAAVVLASATSALETAIEEFSDSATRAPKVEFSPGSAFQHALWRSKISDDPPAFYFVTRYNVVERMGDDMAFVFHKVFARLKIVLIFDEAAQAIEPFL